MEPVASTLRFEDDLKPDRPSVYETVRILRAGGGRIEIAWPSFTDHLYQTREAMRPNLEGLFRDRGVTNRDHLTRALAEFDDLFGQARTIRRDASGRLAPMWAAMPEWHGYTEIVVTTVWNFLLLCNAAMLWRLGHIIFNADPLGNRLPINVNEAGSGNALELSAIRQAMGIKEPLHKAYVVLPGMAASIIVYGPKSLVLSEYRRSLGGGPIAGSFLTAFVIPQVELRRTFGETLPVEYRERDLRVEKVRDERGEITHEF
jgi:hypothetical protein